MDKHYRWLKRIDWEKEWFLFVEALRLMKAEMNT